MKHLGRKVISTVLVCVLLLSVCVLPVSAENAIGTTIYGNTTDDLCFYERVVEMANGDLLATWCREFPVVTNWTGMKTYYFYKSSDNGLTWTQISTLDPSSYGDLSRDKMGMHGLYVFPKPWVDILQERFFSQRLTGTKTRNIVSTFGEALIMVSRGPNIVI